jgi:hypothetical protein
MCCRQVLYAKGWHHKWTHSRAGAVDRC